MNKFCTYTKSYNNKTLHYIDLSIFLPNSISLGHFDRGIGHQPNHEINLADKGQVAFAGVFVDIDNHGIQLIKLAYQCCELIAFNRATQCVVFGIKIKHDVCNFLSGLVRRRSPADSDWRDIKYMVFNLPDSPRSFENRLKRLRSIIAQLHARHIPLIKQVKISSHVVLMDTVGLSEFRARHASQSMAIVLNKRRNSARVWHCFICTHIYCLC